MICFVDDLPLNYCDQEGRLFDLLDARGRTRYKICRQNSKSLIFIYFSILRWKKCCHHDGCIVLLLSKAKFTFLEDDLMLPTWLLNPSSFHRLNASNHYREADGREKEICLRKGFFPFSFIVSSSNWLYNYLNYTLLKF